MGGNNTTIVLNAIILLLIIGKLDCYLSQYQTCQNYQNYTFNVTPSNDIFMNTTMDLDTTLNNLRVYKLVSYGILPNCNFKVRNPALIRVNFTGTNVTTFNPLPPVLPPTQTTEVFVMNFTNTNNASQFYYFVIPIQQNSSGYNLGQWQFLNLLSTIGTAQGYFGYIDPTGNIWAEVLQTLGLNYTSSNFTNYTCPADFNNTLQSKYFRYNCLIQRNLTTDASIYYEDYRLNLIAYDWAFWYAVFNILMFMMISNYFDEEYGCEETQKDNYLTFHPLYSIYKCASPITFAPRMRLAIICFLNGAIGWFNALMVYLYVQIWGQADITFAYRLALFPFCAAVFSLFFAFLAGLLANLYYKTHRTYVNNMKQLSTHSEKEVEMERYEEDSFSKLHIYYFGLGVVGLFFFVMPVWFLYFRTLENQGWWLLQVVISLAWKYLVFDVIFTLFGKTVCGYNFMKLWGFWFDYELHEEFVPFYKLK